MFRLKTSNGETIAVSEGYKTNAPGADVVEV
ncbi:DUF1508 domain-containing protein [Subtercola sp. YIM 133946]